MYCGGETSKVGMCRRESSPDDDVMCSGNLVFIKGRAGKGPDQMNGPFARNSVEFPSPEGQRLVHISPRTAGFWRAVLEDSNGFSDVTTVSYAVTRSGTVMSGDAITRSEEDPIIFSAQVTYNDGKVVSITGLEQMAARLETPAGRPNVVRR